MNETHEHVWQELSGVDDGLSDLREWCSVCGALKYAGDPPRIQTPGWTHSLQTHSPHVITGGPIIGFLAMLPPHENTLQLSHNPHSVVYQTVLEYTRENDDQWVSEEEKNRAIETNEMWELYWYPQTPVTSHTIYASSLEALLRRVANLA